MLHFTLDWWTDRRSGKLSLQKLRGIKNVIGHAASGVMIPGAVVVYMQFRAVNQCAPNGVAALFQKLGHL